MLKEKLIELRERIINEASIVESMIEKCIQGLLERKPEKLEEVFVYEGLVNNKDIEIEEFCISLIALYHPEAKDLRTVLMSLKMNSDYERMGDMAVNIAQSAKFLIERPPLKHLIDLPAMATETVSMIKDSLKSYIEEDAELAKQICERDSIVDDYKENIIRILITYMISDPTNIERSINLLRITSNLEKIADLCTNLAEEVIFIVKGKVIKHRSDVGE